jgi:hypothetical protein
MSTAQTPQQWRSLPQQAKRIGKAEGLLRQAVQAGELEASRPTRRNLILSDESVDRWLQSKRVDPNLPPKPKRRSARERWEARLARSSEPLESPSAGHRGATRR